MGNFFNKLDLFDSLINDFNKKSKSVKIDSRNINLLINSYMAENEENLKYITPASVNHTTAIFNKFLDRFYKPFYTDFVEASKNGKIERKDIDLLAEAQAIFSIIGYYAFANHIDNNDFGHEIYLNKIKEYQKELTKSFVLDTSHYSINGGTSKEKDTKAQEVLMNSTELLDYKAELIRNGNYHIETIKQNLKELPLHNAIIDTNAGIGAINDNNLRDYIKQYKLLEEKHNNRSFFSRLWHSSEKKLLADAKGKLELIKGMDLFGDDHFNTWLVQRLNKSDLMSDISETTEKVGNIYEKIRIQDKALSNENKLIDKQKEKFLDNEKEANKVADLAKIAYVKQYNVNVKKVKKGDHYDKFSKGLEQLTSPKQIKNYMKQYNITIIRTDDKKHYYAQLSDKTFIDKPNDEIKIGKPENENDKPLNINDEVFNTEKLDKAIEATNQENQDKAIEQDNQLIQ